MQTTRAVLWLLTTTISQAAERPNIVFMLSDDQGWGGPANHGYDESDGDTGNENATIPPRRGGKGGQPKGGD